MSTGTPILALQSSTRSLQSTEKRALRDGTHTHKKTHNCRTLQLRDWIGLEGRFSEKFPFLSAPLWPQTSGGNSFKDHSWYHYCFGAISIDFQFLLHGLVNMLINHPGSVLVNNPSRHMDPNNRYWYTTIDHVKYTEITTVSKTPKRPGGWIKTSLLRRLQAQTLPDATPPIGKIHPFSNMAVTFEPPMRFWYPLGYRKFLITMT